MELIKDLFVYFGYGIIIVFPLIWIIGFIIKSDKFEEIKDRLRIVLTILVGIWLYNFTIAPSNDAIINIVKGWYPNAKNVKVTSMTESKVESDTYQAYVSFNFTNNSTCSSLVTIRKGTEKNMYNYRTKGYNCN